MHGPDQPACGYLVGAAVQVSLAGLRSGATALASKLHGCAAMMPTKLLRSWFVLLPLSAACALPAENFPTSSGPVIVHGIHPAMDTSAMAPTRVLVHTPAGELKLDTIVDPSGAVTVTVDAGDSVTALTSRRLVTPSLVTIAGVEPGDELTPRVSELPITNAGRVVVAVPEHAAADHLAVVLDRGCGDAGDAAAGDVAVVLAAPCAAPGRALALAYGGGQLVGYAVSPVAQLVDGARVAIPGPYVAPGRVGTRIVGTLDGATTVRAGIQWRGVDRSVPLDQQAADVGSGTATLAAPELAFDHLRYVHAADGVRRGTFVIDGRSGPPGDETVDLGVDALPLFDDSSCGPELSWRIGSAADADVVLVHGALAVGDATWPWKLFAPPTAASMAIPTLPADLPQVPLVCTAYWLFDASSLAAGRDARESIDLVAVPARLFDDQVRVRYSVLTAAR